MCVWIDEPAPVVPTTLWSIDRGLARFIFLLFLEIQQPLAFSVQKYMSTPFNYCALIMKYVL